ncbi:hypothetical protein BH10PSE2_BH10PSE2_16650 [soil metagenome]
MLKLVGLVAIGLLSAGACAAQDGSFRFAPGSTVLPPEGYETARELSAWTAVDRFRSIVHVEIEVPAGQPDDMTADQLHAFQLELLTLGLQFGAVDIAPTANHSTSEVATITVRTERFSQPRFGAYIDQKLVYFDRGTEFSDAQRRWIELWPAASGYSPGHRVLVVGNTDTVGSAETNQRLSELRAETIARFLAAHGVAWSDIDILGVGETQLQKITADEVAERVNRRVNVEIYP